VVVAAGLLAVGLSALPAVAQIGGTTTTTTTTEETTTTETGFTLLPPTTTTTTELPDITTTTTRRRTTTTLAQATTTTVAAGPVITLPATTTTTELLQPNAPIELPTTTSLPPTTNVDRGTSAGTIVLLIISALVLIALVLAVFTYRFWRSTRPEPPAVGGTVPGHG
jgi:hypothetical protein